MNNFWRISDDQLEPMAGSNLHDCAKEAVQLAAQLRRPIYFRFNGIDVAANRETNVDHLLRDIGRAMRGLIDGPVGPCPAAELTEEEIASDAKKERARQKRGAQEAAAREKERLQQERRIEEELKDAPALAISDAQAWGKWVTTNQDDYGSAIVRYAERWGRLMQIRMADGSSLEDVAKKAGHDSDTEGITGFMYGAAVSVLASCWQHGEELRKWHNLDTQVHDEGEKANESGGVLNPALLSIG